MQRIENIETSARRILQYAKDQKSKDGIMYAKTRTKLESIIRMCNESAQLLSELLDTQDMVSTKVSGSPKSSKPSFAKINYMYADTLHKLTQKNWNNIPAIQNCISVLDTWFQQRVIKRYTNSVKIHCQYYRNLIPSLIIMYGYYLETNQIDVFYKAFNHFIQNIGTDPVTTHEYVLPYVGFQIAKHGAKSYANLSAQIIFDYLWTNGLDVLSFSKEEYADLRIGGLRSDVITEKLINSELDVLNGYDGVPLHYHDYLNQFTIYGGVV